MTSLTKLEKIIATQPKYKSPSNYENWLAHISLCAKTMLQIIEEIDNYEPESLMHETGRIAYMIYYHSLLMDAAPAYYLSEELYHALQQTNPILPPDAPIALPSFHLMLPAKTFYEQPLSITAVCCRSTDNKRFAVPDHVIPGSLLLGINLRLLENHLISYTFVCSPDFKSMWIHPDIEDVDFKEHQDELGLYQGLRVKAAKLIVQVLLIMQYKPDLITTENASYERATGFGAHKSKTITEYYPTRWLGKLYERKQSNHSPTGSHASPRAHWRKGHWHNFRHGPGRKELKLKWIEPIFVNP